MLKNLRRASVFMFTRRQTLYVNPKTLNPKTLKPQTLKPWKLWIRKQKTLRICSIYCNLSSHVRRQGILNVAVRESVRNIIYFMCIYIYISLMLTLLRENINQVSSERKETSQDWGQQLGPDSALCGRLAHRPKESLEDLGRIGVGRDLGWYRWI